MGNSNITCPASNLKKQLFFGKLPGLTLTVYIGMTTSWID
jgi:hypothetical protein